MNKKKERELKRKFNKLIIFLSFFVYSITMLAKDLTAKFKSLFKTRSDSLELLHVSPVINSGTIFLKICLYILPLTICIRIFKN